MAIRRFAHDEVAAIRARAYERLRAHMNSQGGEHALLKDVATLVRGLVYSQAEEMPLLAVYTGTATPEANQQSVFRTSWIVPVRVRAVVDHDDPEEGAAVAVVLAGRAMHALTGDPETGEIAYDLPAPDGGVYDLAFGPFETTVGPGRAPNLVEARSGVVARFETSY